MSNEQRKPIIPEITPLEREAAEHVRRLRESHVHTKRTERIERRRERREHEQEPQDWSAWNRWADARIEAALAVERELIVGKVAEAIEAMCANIEGFDRKLAKLQTLLQSLQTMPDTSEPIDLPAMRAIRRDVN